MGSGGMLIYFRTFHVRTRGNWGDFGNCIVCLLSEALTSSCFSAEEDVIGNSKRAM